MKHLIAAAVLGTAFLSHAVFAADADSVAARIKQMYPSTTFNEVRATVLPGLFEITMGRNVAYTDAEGRYFLFGHLFDMKTQQDLTASHVEALTKVDFGALPLDHAIKTVRGNGSRVFAVFSDPDCPYCKRLESELTKLSDVTIYTFLFPLESLHANSKAKAVSTWCAADRAGAWDDMMLRGKEPAPAQCDNPIEQNIKLGGALGVNGTPTLVSADGRILPGAAGADKIAVWLSGAGKVSMKGDQ